MKYRPKIREVDAVQWLGHNLPDVTRLLDGLAGVVTPGAADPTELVFERSLLRDSVDADDPDSIAEPGDYVVRIADRIVLISARDFLSQYEAAS